MANTYLSRTFGSGGSPGTLTWTLSTWFKRSNLTGEHVFMSSYINSAKYVVLKINGNNKFEFRVYNSADQWRYTTTMKFMDTSAWYHLVISFDSTQSTASERVIIYINGERITAFDASTTSGQNHNGDFNEAKLHTIGGRNSADYFNGYMSDFNFISGTRYLATDFGEIDTDTGEWRIKDMATLTYGTNGFRILNDGNTITDQSANSNNWTSNGAGVTNTEDCPSDVFATMNPLNVPTSNAPIFTNGNTYSQSATGGTQSSAFSGSSTLGMTAGKYYIEAKAVVTGDSRSGVGISGEASTQAKNNDSGSGLSNSSYLYTSEGGTIYSPSGNISGHPTYANNDIIGIAVDVTNLKVYFSKNGVFENSHNPSAGSGGISITAVSSTTDGAYFVSGGSTAGGGASSAYSAMYFNFGNGYFGTTQITGTTYSPTVGNTGAVFKYAVPTNYTALSTKGLNN